MHSHSTIASEMTMASRPTGKRSGSRGIYDRWRNIYHNDDRNANRLCVTRGCTRRLGGAPSLFTPSRSLTGDPGAHFETLHFLSEPTCFCDCGSRGNSYAVIAAK